MASLIQEIKTASDEYLQKVYSPPQILLVNPLDYDNVVKNGKIFSGTKVYQTEGIHQGEFKIF